MGSSETREEYVDDGANWQLYEEDVDQKREMSERLKRLSG